MLLKLLFSVGAVIGSIILLVLTFSVLVKVFKVKDKNAAEISISGTVVFITLAFILSVCVA